MEQRLLVVGHDAWWRKLVEAAFVARGLRVEGAMTGEEGYAKALAIEPNVALIDLTMPRRDGWSLLRLMRAHVALRPVPVVVLSTGDEDRAMATKGGANDYLAKPFRIGELELRVAALLCPGVAASRPAHTSANRGLRGTLADLALSSLLTLVELERKSGVLIVQHAGETGRLALRAGKVVAVRCHTWRGERLVGMEAVCRLLTWSDGEFKLTVKPVEVADELEGIPTQLLLLEAARRTDEEAAERASVAS